MKKKWLGCIVVMLLLVSGCAKKTEAYSKSELTYDFDYLSAKIEALHPSILCLKDYEERKDAFYKRALSDDGNTLGSILKEYLSPYVKSGIRCLLDVAALQQLIKEYDAAVLMELHVLDNDAAKKRYGKVLQEMERYHKKKSQAAEKAIGDQRTENSFYKKDEQLRSWLLQKKMSAVIALPESGYLIMIRPDEKVSCS